MKTISFEFFIQFISQNALKELKEKTHNPNFLTIYCNLSHLISTY